MVSNAAANSSIFPGVFYTSGVYAALGAIVGDQTLVIQSGAISEAEFLANAWQIFPTGSTPLTAKLFDRRYVTGGAVTGTAGIAAGSTMTVTNSNTMQMTTLQNGDFSIPTGVGGLGAARPRLRSADPVSGRRELMSGADQFAGGARHRQVAIGLTNTNLSLRSIRAVSRSKHPVYSLTAGHFVLGGSEYRGNPQRGSIESAGFASEPDLPDENLIARSRRKIAVSTSPQ